MFLKCIRHARTASPARLAPKYIASTYLGSQTTAPPNVSVFSSPTFSSSHSCPIGETGRIRKRDPQFSKIRSVGELPEATNESLCDDIMPLSGEDALESNGEGLRWVLPPTRPYPFFRRLAPVAFSARLLECQLHAHS